MHQLKPNDYCHHTKTALAKRLIGGNEHFGAQCLTCGKWEPIKKGALSFHQTQEAVDFDIGLSENFWSAQAEVKAMQRAREEAAKNQKFWTEYDAYLESEKWKEKRRRVFERDKQICQACLKRPAEQAHHLTYARVFDEPLFDLISVCTICHEAIHW